MRFGTESVIQVFIEIIHSIGEKENNIMFIEDNITLYTDRVERWLIELCNCIICYKWDDLFLIINEGENL